MRRYMVSLKDLPQCIWFPNYRQAYEYCKRNRAAIEFLEIYEDYELQAKEWFYPQQKEKANV